MFSRFLNAKTVLFTRFNFSTMTSFPFIVPLLIGYHHLRLLLALKAVPKRESEHVPAFCGETSIVLAMR